MERWLTRWAPLSGAVATILVVVSFATGGSTPDDNASAAAVLSFYRAHATSQKVSAVLGVLGLAFLVLFAVSLAARARAGGSSGWLANSAVGGAVFAALSLASLIGFSLVLASDVKFLTGAEAQLLNVLDDDLFLPAVAGFFVFGVLAGLAAVTGRTPARWMGWVLFAVGICAAIPPITFFAFLATFLWSLVAGIWLAVRQPAVRSPEPDAQLAAAA